MPSLNTQQLAARITNAVVQRTLMDNHPPVGEDSDTIRSQVVSENPDANENESKNLFDELDNFH